ncbi:MAG: thermonuclease family protein [Anaeroplasmataceae bacterium]|nr:thermonuclease family protein [Anaeroplasmataceae bacterium]MDE6413964.1 thermonuclease family protein [Anaeroplasmataceae bacterium]
MKNIRKILLVLCFVLCLGIFASCKEENPEPTPTPTPTPTESIDYVAQTKLSVDVTAAHSFFGQDGIAIATLVRCVDGDTAVFIANDQEFTARFLGVDTPESTGQVEEWGKTASKFTASKLLTANAIVVQTDGGPAQVDSTGNRYLTYVWYQPEAGAAFRLLNLELVQEGLSYGKYSTIVLYSSQFEAANSQAVIEGHKVFSKGKEKDPNYYYGKAQETTIKYIIENQKELIEGGVAVKFDCTVTKVEGLYVYVQDYDAEDNKVYSLMLYKGYNLNTAKLEPGNRVSIYGNVQEYNNQVQISNMQDIGVQTLKNIQLLEKNYEIITTTITGEQLLNASDDTERLLVKLEKVKVTKVYTTTSGSSAGAMTITGVTPDGKTVTLRTVILRLENYDIVTEDYFLDKTITVVGLIETYNNTKQIKIVSINDVTFIE